MEFLGIEISHQTMFITFKWMTILCAIGSITGMVMMLWADKREFSRAYEGLFGCVLTIICLLGFIVFSLLGGAARPL